MTRFYVSLITETFQNLARWGGVWRLLVTIVLAISLLFNKQIGDKFLTEWNGLNPAWALVPIAAGWFFLLLRVNYDRHETVRKEIHNLKSNQPKLIIEPKIDRRSPRDSNGQRVRALIAQLDITNNSRVEFYATSRIRYQEISSDQVFKVEGLWLEKRAIPQEKTTLAEPLNFRAGERNKLAIAAQFDGETDWYALDSAGPFARYKNRKYKLTGPVRITVSLEGNMLPITRCYELKEEEGQFRFDAV